MKKWEYRHFNEKLEERDLNRLGEDGWELVSHTAVAVAGLTSRGFGQYYIFKREKSGQINS